jgi:hypothetical protein
MRAGNFFVAVLLLVGATLVDSAEGRAESRADRLNRRFNNELFRSMQELELDRQRMKTGVFGLRVSGGVWELSPKMAAEARRVAARGNGQTINVPRGSALGRALANLADGRLGRNRTATTPLITVERWGEDVRVTLHRRWARGRDPEPDVYHIEPSGHAQYVAIPPRATRTGLSGAVNSQDRSLTR